ncbi:alginate export family protein [Sphingomonas sp. PB4P5]
MSCAAPAAAQTAAAPDVLDFSGTSRLRVEAIDGQARAGFNEFDELLNLRTTLMAQYRDGPVRFVAELWDSRIYGDDRGTPVTTGEVNALELVQAFAEVKMPGLLGKGSGATIAAGRFVMNLGSRRLVAADDYRNTTNGYTGLRADLTWRAGWNATLIYTLPQQRRPDDLARLRRNAVGFDHEGFDLVLWGGLVSRARAVGAATLEASLFHLGERDQPGRATRDRSLHTGSVRLIRDPAPAHIDGEVEAILQRGHVSSSVAANAQQQAVRSWFIHADTGYTFTDPWKTRVSVEYDHASGDKPGGANRRFDTLFGMRRADLAPAGLYNAISRSNVISPGVRIEAVPDKRTDLMMTLHPMWLAAREDSFSSTGVRDASGRSGSFAGTQLEGRIRHQPMSWLRLELDAVLLAKGRFLREAPNAPAGRWTRYLSLNATATF